MWAYPANLAYGVTTTRDPQTGTTDVLTYWDLVTTGRVLGPRIYSTGPGVFGAQEQIRSLDHARDVLRRYSDYYDTKTIKMYVAGNREQRQWIIMAARELGLMPTTEGSLDAKMDLTMAIDGYPGQEHNLPVFPIYRDVVQLFADSKITYTPTILVAYGGPWAENYFYTPRERLTATRSCATSPHEELMQKALRRRPGAGLGRWFHPEVHVFRATPQGSWTTSRTPAAGSGWGATGSSRASATTGSCGAAVRRDGRARGAAGRHDPRRAGHRAGPRRRLHRGREARRPGGARREPAGGHPQLSNISRVMKNGRLYEAGTLDEVWPRQRPAGPWYWQNDPAVPDTRAGIR